MLDTTFTFPASGGRGGEEHQDADQRGKGRRRFQVHSKIVLIIMMMIVMKMLMLMMSRRMRVMMMIIRDWRKGDVLKYSNIISDNF